MSVATAPTAPAAARTGAGRAPAAVNRLLDRTVGRISMYRLLLAVLAALAGWALVLSAAGRLPFSAVDLAVALAVVGVATWLSSVGYARLFGATAHPESSLITAALIAFLVWPSTDPLSLAAFALAGLAASASKFLLVARGRHLFNPAAFGVLFVTVLQLTGGVWWAATPAMLPAVALGAALVWYRSGTAAIGGTVVLVGGALLVAARLAAGDGPAAAVGYAVVSTPLVFLAGFMATEPLTLPPLRRQRVAVAAVVGALFALPAAVEVHLGPVALTPEIALLAGNLLAFALARQGGTGLSFRGSRRVGERTVEYAFTADRPLRLSAGQYIELTLPHARPDARGTRRVFSVVSPPAATPPADGTEVRIATTQPADPSTFKRALAAIESGARLRIARTAGDFALPADETVPLLLIAGSVGITPFIAQLPEIVGRDAVLVHAVRGPADLAYVAELAGSGLRVVVLCPASLPGLPAGWSVVHDRLDAHAMLAAVPDLANRHAMIAGSPGMVAEAGQAVRAAGGRRVTVDAFTRS